MLLATLLHQGEIGILTETLIHRLTLPEAENLADNRWRKNLTQIIQSLSSAEKNAVYKFLLKCRELYPTEGWDYSEYQEEELEQAIQFWSTLKDNSPSAQ